MRYRSQYAAQLTDAWIGSEVLVAGWVARIRDQGGVIFFDLRDHDLVQVVVNPEQSPELADAARSLRREFCVSVRGTVRIRPAGTENPELATGSIEIEALTLEVLSPAEPLPFQLDERTEVDELVRLEYRYLDLRRRRMATNLRTRAKVASAMRSELDRAGFLEVETPTLIRSTPEGARDVLVPSRLRQGNFYALPQSPQLFKQLLMIGGIDRYYQIARCYRDEDFRADRQLEFTQLDVEGAFWERDDVLATIERVMAAVVLAVRGEELQLPLPRITYAEAMKRFGTDKPDLRFGMELIELGRVFAETEFKEFASALAGGGVVVGLNLGKKELSRRELDALVEEARQLGAAGMVWMVTEPDGFKSPVAKFFSKAELDGVREQLAAGTGDLLLAVADRAPIARAVLGRMRIRFGQPADHAQLALCWVVEFPMFEVGEGEALIPAHHPFTAPVDVSDLGAHPAQAVAKAYDLVLNGAELGSGSIRIHDPEVQRQVFEVLGIEAAQAERRFGWFLRALSYGTPPHAGFAMGIDRLVSILCNQANIREVIPFPKTQTGFDPLTQAPTRVEEAQLRELGLRLRPEVEAEQ